MDILLRNKGRAGYATLNRPKALNALTYQMCLSLEAALRSWLNEDDIDLILIDGAGDRAFCAGGDIVDMYREGLDGQDQFARQFWRDEYRLNGLIATYDKPYVAVMDGIVMGGGVGVSAHGSHRVVTERTMFAMPECSIGLIPDVGGSLLLANMPGRCGEYAGLTGARLTGADCVYAGLADHFVTSNQLDALKSALIESGDVNVITQFEETPPQSILQENQGWIDQVFSAVEITEIAAKLDADDTEIAKATAKGLSRAAPLSSLLALQAIRRAREHGSLALALRDEYRVVSASVRRGEFVEGIRAAVIDKDRNPQWAYPTFSDIPDGLRALLDTTPVDGDFKLV